MYELLKKIFPNILKIAQKANSNGINDTEFNFKTILIGKSINTFSFLVKLYGLAIFSWLICFYTFDFPIKPTINIFVVFFILLSIAIYLDFQVRKVILKKHIEENHNKLPKEQLQAVKNMKKVLKI